MALVRKLTSKIYDIQAHTQKVTALDIGETGRVLVTGGQDRNVNLWAFGDEKCFMSLSGHNGQVDSVKFANGDDLVYSADENGIIKRWDLNASANGRCVTFYGHMKSVRTLDFHPHGAYVFASGSNDTTVRLWDVRQSDSGVSKYRGHIANVNSVKFSPDGWWIASAGTEGSVIIWDIRSTKKEMEFQEHASPVTCITFHPFDLLLAAGRNDGTVDLYDLEASKLISRTDGHGPFHGQTVKCITFGENGDCCFVGSAEGISVIGWEPDREFDHIESAWSILGDMKIVKKKLLCGSYEKQAASVHAINLDHVIPYYNPSNIPFSYNQSTRKSFNRGSKMALPLKSHSGTNNNNNFSLAGGKDRQTSPTSINFEIIDESYDETPPIPAASTAHAFAFEKLVKSRDNYIYSLPSENNHTNEFADNFDNQSPSSENDIYLQNLSADLDFYPERMSELEPEEFPINSAQQPDYAPKMDNFHGSSNVNVSKVPRPKVMQVRKSSLTQSSTRSTLSQAKKLSNSTIDLHSIDDSNSHSLAAGKKGTFSRNGSPTRNFTSFGSNNNNNNKAKRNDTAAPKETNHARNNRKITVQIMAKPPPRSKTSLDLRSSSAMSHSQHSLASGASSIVGVPAASMAVSQPKQFAGGSAFNGHGGIGGGGAMSSEENAEISVLTAYHERVYQQLSTRYATIQLIRNSTRSHDITGALRNIVKMQDHSVLVDLLGAILEKPASWNLDMVALLLPAIYELLQSEHKFHFARACDTLRIILSTFLPIIQANSSVWSRSTSYGGVDISREERQKKCMECAHWLCKIKVLPDNQHMGSNLTQLQNLIVDI